MVSFFALMLSRKKLAKWADKRHIVYIYTIYRKYCHNFVTLENGNNNKTLLLYMQMSLLNFVQKGTNNMKILMWTHDDYFGLRNHLFYHYSFVWKTTVITTQIFLNYLTYTSSKWLLLVRIGCGRLNNLSAVFLCPPEQNDFGHIMSYFEFFNAFSQFLTLGNRSFPI